MKFERRKKMISLWHFFDAGVKLKWQPVRTFHRGQMDRIHCSRFFQYYIAVGVAALVQLFGIATLIFANVAHLFAIAALIVAIATLIVAYVAIACFQFHTNCR